LREPRDRVAGSLLVIRGRAARGLAASANGTTDKRLGSYLAPDLLVIDDFGLKPLPPTGAVDLYDVINGRYEKGSIVLTSNRAPEEWSELFSDALLANAALDRLAHGATMLMISGRSYRLAHRPTATEEPMTKA
jgi:DNA replication protein DnaC